MQLLLCLIACLHVNCTYCMEKLLILVLSCVQSSDWLQWCRLLWELQYTQHGDRARHACVEIVKYVDLYSTSSRSASNALPLPVSRRWSPQANPTARHQRTLQDHVIRVGVSWDVSVYSSSLGRLRLSRPGCLVLRRGGLPRHLGTSSFFCMHVINHNWSPIHETVTHWGTNRAWRRVTTLISRNMLPLR